MWQISKQRFDVATTINQGGREYQQDALLADFPVGGDTGIAILADGMGGQSAGGVASALCLSEAFAEVRTQFSLAVEAEGSIPGLLRASCDTANAAIAHHVSENPTLRGMGSTLVACAAVENKLYWASIGDSPLYLLRGGVLQQINEDHSMAPRIAATRLNLPKSWDTALLVVERPHPLHVIFTNVHWL